MTVTEKRKNEENEEEENAEKQLENIRKKLKGSNKKPKPVEAKPAEQGEDDDEALEEYYLGKDRDEERKKKM